jgi:hypothetical protein
MLKVLVQKIREIFTIVRQKVEELQKHFNRSVIPQMLVK